MIYLHESIVKFHGSLTTSNCLVDSRWVVKLSDFGLHEFKRDAEVESDDVMKKYRGEHAVIFSLNFLKNYFKFEGPRIQRAQYTKSKIIRY